MYIVEVQETIRVVKALERFWSSCYGWAPPLAAELLAEARLDRQVAFAHTLPDYFAPFPPESYEARLIIGYTTLRSMAEGALKLFFSVWIEDYRRDADAIRTQKGLVPPEEIKFDRLITLFSKKTDAKHDSFLRRIQYRGNAIHHFVDRDIGSQQDLIDDIHVFGDFLLTINAFLPYPDETYDPTSA